MRRLALTVQAGLLLLVLSACGTGEPAASNAVTPPTSTAAQARVYEADTMVLEQRAGAATGAGGHPVHGPMLCLGAMAMSYPPQCGEVPITNWDWDAVEGEEKASGASWGNFHVVGTYDGRKFTVSEVRPYEDHPPTFWSEVDFSSPCQEPEGGWVLPDPEQVMQQDASVANGYAQRQPDVVSSWVTHIGPEEPTGAVDEYDPVILNAVFTGDVERHEAEMRKRWPGPLCVVEGEGPTKREQMRVRALAEAYLTDELGLHKLGSGCCGVEPVVEIGVVADREGAAQAALDARWPGIVRLFPALRPVESSG
jgi:hypothetical protein